MKWISCLPSKQLLGVRIPPGAQNAGHLMRKISCPLDVFSKGLFEKDFIRSVDNYVGNVYKGHKKYLSFKEFLFQIHCKIRIF